MRKLEQLKTCELGLICTAECWGLIPGVQDFGYEPSVEITAHRSGMGADGIVALTAATGGVQGGFDVEGVENEDLALRYIMRKAEADFVGFDISQARSFFIYSNVKDEDDNHIRGHFVRLARLSKVPGKVAPAAKRLDFQAVKGIPYNKAVYAEAFEGAVEPLTALTLTETAVKDETGSYALLVMRNGVILEETTDYTATATVVTLTVGLGLTDKAVVAYLYDPAAEE